MKAAAIRKLCEAHETSVLEGAAETLAETGEAPIAVDGDDAGEQLTHVLLATRVRQRMDKGEPLKDAFRAEMAAVRDLLTND
jgi:hypothetical protein